jgi:hypothetical protein
MLAFLVLYCEFLCSVFTFGFEVLAAVTRRVLSSETRRHVVLWRFTGVLLQIRPTSAGLHPTTSQKAVLLMSSLRVYHTKCTSPFCPSFE